MEDPNSPGVSSVTAESSTEGNMITPAMLEEELGWAEDNIQIDFMTVDDLRRLLEKSGHKIEANIYRESATLVASMVKNSSPGLPLSGASSTPSPPPSVSGSGGTSLTHLVANTFSRTGSFESPPSSPSAPTPLTLSLGSWSITEEEFPLYIGSAAGLLLLVFVLLSATTWRCLAAGDRKRRRRQQEDLEKRLNSPSLLSSNSHVHHISSDKDRFIINVHTMIPPEVSLPPEEVQRSGSNNNRPTEEQPVVVNAARSAPAFKESVNSAIRAPETQTRQTAQETLQPNELLAQIIRNDLNKKKSHDSMVLLSGSRIESRIIDPYGKDDGHERNSLLRDDIIRSSPKSQSTVGQGSRIVTDVDDVIGLSSPKNSSQMDEMNTYVKLAPVVDNFLASQATFHTFQPSSRLSKKQSSDGMSSSKTSPNELDLDESLTAAEMAELQEEARDTFRSLPLPGRRLTSDFYNGNVSLLLSEEEESSLSIPEMMMSSLPGGRASSSPAPSSLSLPPLSLNNNNNANFNNSSNGSKLYASNNNHHHYNNNNNNAQSTLEDLYSKVDYNSKLKNRCPHDGVAVVSPLPPHKSPSPSLLSFSKQQTSLCEDDEEITFVKAGGGDPSMSNSSEPTLLYNIRTSL